MLKHFPGPINLLHKAGKVAHASISRDSNYLQLGNTDTGKEEEKPGTFLLRDALTAMPYRPSDAGGRAEGGKPQKSIGPTSQPMIGITTCFPNVARCWSPLFLAPW